MIAVKKVKHIPQEWYVRSVSEDGVGKRKWNRVGILTPKNQKKSYNFFQQH